jgi:hypothetical protein
MIEGVSSIVKAESKIEAKHRFRVQYWRFSRMETLCFSSIGGGDFGLDTLPGFGHIYQQKIQFPIFFKNSS